MNKQYLVVSFMTTHFSRLKRHWQKHNILKHKGALGTDRPPTEFLGGKIVIFDWDLKTIVWEIDLDLPTGIVCSQNMIFVNTLKNEILGFDRFKNIQYRIKNAKFNSLHSLERTKHGFLVTSSGLDLVLEVDIFGNSIFEWWATENGFENDLMGRLRILDKNINQTSNIYPTIFQTTHVNSAIYHGRDHLLATLFHQGKLIKINKKTGRHKVLLDGLSKPHAIHKTKNGFILSDTRNDKVIFLNKSLNQTGELKRDFSWVQDAIVLSNNNLIVADADNTRLVEVSAKTDRRVISSFDFHKEWRLFQVRQIPQKMAEMFLR